MALSVSIFSILAGSAFASLDCRPNGPVVPRPTDLSNSTSFTDALSDLTAALQRAVDGEINAGFPVENSSFSLGIVSISQEDPGVPLWEFHHLSPNNVNGTKDVGRDSQYLIGSVSKVISDLVLLKSGVDPDTPAREYLPELKGGRVDWEDITLRDLGNHLGGITTNEAGFAEYYYLKDLLVGLGFPPLEDSAYPSCGVIALNKACDEEAFLQNLVDGYPVAPPAKTPVYSSIAFSTFALALERATGKNYTDLLDEHVAAPLGLKSTRPSPGDDDVAVIPAGESTWGSDYGISAPGGGLVSTLSDLSIFLHALLSRSDAVLPSTDIDRWLKPDSATGGLRTLVGLPWEIFRADGLTPEHPHVVEIYAKGGGAYGYRSQIAVLDDYGVGLVLLTAGDGTALTSLYDAVLGTVVPAVDKAAREQAEKYTGTFSTENDGVPVIAEIEQDEDSIILTCLTRNGSDIISGIQELFNQGLGSIVGFKVSKPRLFPTQIEEKTTVDGKEVIREDWRMMWGDVQVGEVGELPGQGATRGDCLTWTVMDWLHYGREPLDRFVFVRDGTSGDVLGFETPFLRAGILAPGE